MATGTELTPRNRHFLARQQKRERPGPHRALVASARPLDLKNKTEARRLRVLRQNWQQDAAAYVDNLPELSFAYRFLAHASSRMRYFPALVNPEEPDGPPIPAHEVPGTPDGLIDCMNEAMAALGVGRQALSPMQKSLSYQFGVTGEALDVDTIVATPTGFTRMGDLATGDEILGGDGRVCRVLVAHPIRENRDCYEVRLTGGVRIIADGDHKWLTHRQIDRQYARRFETEYEPVVVSTVEMAETIKDGKNANHAIELTAVTGTARTDPGVPDHGFASRTADRNVCEIDPYVLGYWLGDGTAANGSITIHTDDQAHVRQRFEAAGYGWSVRSSYHRPGFCIGILGLQAQLRRAGLLDNKHVPSAYLRSDEATRWALLQGLIDSDGHVDKRGRVEFSNINIELLWNVVELASSLGLRPGQPKRNRVTFTSAGMPVASLPRKAERIRARTEEDRWRYVQEITQVKSRPVRCITVDSPDQTFLVTEHMVRTHNCFLTGMDNPLDGEDTWQVRSIDEFQVYDDTYKLREVPLDPQGTLGWIDLDPATTYAARMWVPHWRFAMMATSPMRSLLDVSEELLLLSRDVRATARSRLAGGGILKFPDGLRMETMLEDDMDPEGETVFGQLAQAMMTPLTDEGVASSVIPIAISGDLESLAGLEHMLIDRPYSALALELRAEAIGRLSTGLDVPREVLEGMSDPNHWGAWLVSDDTFRHHIEPQVITQVDAMSIAYLRAWLTAAGQPKYWVDRACIWYNPVDLISKPDPMANAILLHDRYAISNEALRLAGGFKESDAPGPLEVEFRMLQHTRTFPPNMVEAIFHKVDPELQFPAISTSGTIPGIGPSGEIAAEPAAAPVEDAPPPEPDVGAPGPGASAPSAPGMSTPGATVFRTQINDGYLRQSRKLTDIDTDVRARLQVAACAAMTRALERSGAKLRSRVSDKKFRGADTRAGIDTSAARFMIEDLPNRLVASVLGETLVASLGFASGKELAGADWSELKAQFMEWTEQAQRQAIKTAASLARLGDSHDLVARTQHRMSQSLDPAWQAFEEDLDAILNKLLYPATGPVETVTFDPNTVVPTGTVRHALTIAGGHTPKALTADAGDDGAIDVSEPVPPGENPEPASVSVTLAEGGIGNGEAVTDMLVDSGNVEVATYEWVHGPTMRPFEPHEDLDGVSFSAFDDPALANDGDWPDNDYFFPGDHDGCSCFPGDTMVSAVGLLGATRRWYDGDLVEIVTARGNRLAGTPNHPVLTPDGWVPLGQVAEGCYVVSDSSPVSIPIGLDPHETQDPSRIEDLFGTALGAFGGSPMTVPSSAMDFHGDGADGEVDVVWTDRFLTHRRQAPIDQFVEDELLESGTRAGVALAGQGSCDAPSDLSLSRFGSRPRGSGTGTGTATPSTSPLELRRVAERADLHPAADQALANGAPVDPEPFGDGQFGLAGSVGGTDGGHVQVLTPLPTAPGHESSPPFDGHPGPSLPASGGSESGSLGRRAEQAPLSQNPSESVGVHAYPLGRIGVRRSRDVVSDRVLHVIRRRFSGHVYNLHTESNRFVAGSIVVHNCDFSTVWGPASDTDTEPGEGGGDTDVLASAAESMSEGAASFTTDGGTVETLDASGIEQAKYSLEDMRELIGGDLVPGSREEMGYRLTGFALDSADEADTTVIAATADGQGLAGAVAVQMRPVDEESGMEAHLLVQDVGSTQIVRGTGSALVQKVYQMAAEQGLAVMGEPLADAIPFWEKMGWTEDPLGIGSHQYGLTAAQVATIVGHG